MAKNSLMGVLCLAITMSGVAACAAAVPGTEETEETETSGGREEHIKGAQSAKAYPAAVLIDTLENGEVVSACSGALIAPRIVLTAGHCLRDGAAWRVVSPSLGQAALADLAEPFDDLEDGNYVHPESYDVGLLRLTRPLFLPAYPALTEGPLAAGARVVSVGRIHDGELSFDSLFASKPVRAYDAADIGFPHAYRATEKIESGDSGGPVFASGIKPQTIAAVSSGSGDGVEVLARVDLVLPWIEGFAAEHGDPVVGPYSPAGACKHPVCQEGKRLAPDCHPCAGLVCAGDAYCCTTAWDDQCVAEASLACGACGP